MFLSHRVRRMFLSHRVRRMFLSHRVRRMFPSHPVRRLVLDHVRWYDAVFECQVGATRLLQPELGKGKTEK